MKVVLFCGGQGLRMREASEVAPKPMIPVGNRPVLWHVMKYYAHFGFTDFVLCLGYKAEVIKHFFLTYNEAMANDFVLSDGGAKVHLLKTDIHNWNITFVDTGLHSSIGERLRAVREHLLGDDELFLANYGDTLTDADLPAMIERAKDAGAMASFLAVRPNYSFHVVSVKDDGLVGDISDVTKSDIWINGGYFVLRTEFSTRSAPARTSSRSRSGASPRGASCSPTATRASGRRWTRSRTSSGSRACTRAARPRGSSGTPTDRRATWPRTPSPPDAAALASGRPEAPPRRCSRSAPIPTTSRSAAAARCSS